MMNKPLLSVIVPVYNEAGTIKEILAKIEAIGIDKEIIVVDDGSDDNTARLLHEIKYDNLKVIHHPSNRGKGAAFLTGLSHSEGEFVVIQDADLEYDPVDYSKLLYAIEADKADIVLGARFTRGYKGLLFHKVGNKFLTELMNLLFGAHLNDYFTCYKFFRRETVLGLNLKASGFDIDTEIVSKVLKRRLRVLEVPVSYHPRAYSQGKKIRWHDGIFAIINMFKYRLNDDR